MGLPARIADELAKATPVALPLGEGLPLDRWVELGKQLCLMDGGVRWWVGDWWAFGEAAYGERAAAAADNIFGRTFQTLANAASVCRSFSETSRRREVLTFSHHVQVTALEPAQADKLLDEAERENLSVRHLRNRVDAFKHGDRLAQIELKSLGNTSLPTGRSFPVILADPPWLYESSDPRLDAANHYPVMTTEKICAMTVKTDIAADDGILFLWATGAKLVEALEVIKAWGFEYRTNFVWVKDRTGLGHYSLGQHELLLIAKRGKMVAPLLGTQQSSVIDAPRREHSRKPDIVYEIIEKLYPNVGRMELFGRGPARPGWAVWGNEAKQPATGEQHHGEQQPPLVSEKAVDQALAMPAEVQTLAAQHAIQSAE